MGAITAEVVESDEKRDARGRRVTSAKRRAEWLQAYATSGSTMAAFARREGIKYATFAQLRLPLAAPAAERPDDRLEVRLPDGTMVRGHRALDLIALVRALRS